MITSDHEIAISEADETLVQYIVGVDRYHVLLLPSQVEDGHPIFPSTANDVRKILVAGGLETALTPPGGARYAQMRSIDWQGPTLFISVAAFIAHPHVVSIALNLIASYLFELFRKSTTNIKLTILTDSGRTAVVGTEGAVVEAPAVAEESMATPPALAKESTNDIKLDVIAEISQARTYQSISYHGSIDGLKDLIPVVEKSLRGVAENGTGKTQNKSKQ